jgi:hypothetical protein
MRIEPQLDGYNMASVMWVDDSDIPQRFSLINSQEREHDEIGLTSTIPDNESSCNSSDDSDDMVIDTTNTTSQPSNHNEGTNDDDDASCSNHHNNRTRSTNTTVNDSVAAYLGASLLAAAATVSSNEHHHRAAAVRSTSLPTTAVVTNVANADMATRNAAASLFHPHSLLDPNLIALSQLIYTRMMQYRQQATHTQRQQIDNVYGIMPDNDAQALSFWAASVVPIDKHIRYNALVVGSVRNRLILVSEWLDALDRMHQNWWRSSTCAVM